MIDAELVANEKVNDKQVVTPERRQTMCERPT